MIDLPPANHKHLMRSPQRRLLRVRLVAFAMLLALVATACGGADNSVQATQATSDSADSASDAMTANAADAEATDAEPQSAPVQRLSIDQDENESGDADKASLTGSAGAQPTSQLPDLGRDIIYTATLELASTNVSNATRSAIQAVEARGGFLFSQETTGGSGATSVLTFKVLPEQFQAVLNELGSIGDVRAQSISADDVTAVVVDLESRISTAEASVARLRNLLEEASELDTIATLENQLLQRETTLEQYRGQLRTVRNQVDLATITVFVSELLNRPGVGIDVMTFAGHDGGFSCFDASSARSGEAGDPMTLCYRLTNTGDTPLVDLTIDDPSLGASIGDMVVVDGDVGQIDPGETVILAHEFELTEPVRVRSSVTATGLDQGGDPLADMVMATAGSIRFDVTNLDEGFPSFGEVLASSWSMLVKAAIVIALIAVAIAPFLAVGLLLGWFGLQILRRMRPRPIRLSQRPTRAAPPAPETSLDDAEANEDSQGATV